MKKILAFLLTVVLVLSASVCVAFAAPASKGNGQANGVGNSTSASQNNKDKDKQKDKDKDKDKNSAVKPSAEAQGVISGITVTDADEKEVTVKVEKIDKKVNKHFYNTLTGLKNETKKKNLKVIGHYDVAVEGNPEYPLNVVLDVLGVSASSDVYVLVQKGDEVVAVTPTVKDGKVMFELEEKVDKIALVTDGKTADKVEKETGVKSPQTADASAFVIVAMFMSAICAAFVSKKVKA